MKCQQCGINTATTHIKTVVNGEFEEYMLCPECAKKMGYTSIFNDFTSDFNNLLGSFFTNALPARTQATRCPVCGSTYTEIAKCGQVGCAKCYETFEQELLPSIKRMHGNTTHCGKKSEQNKAPKAPEKSKLDELKKKLNKAVDEQEFEQAAKLRDEIKALEGNNHEQ